MGQLSLDVGDVSRAIHYFEIALSQACMHLYMYVCVYTYTYIQIPVCTHIHTYTYTYLYNKKHMHVYMHVYMEYHGAALARRRQRIAERWGAGVETQKNVRGEIGGWGRVPFNEPYAPSLSTIYDGA